MGIRAGTVALIALVAVGCGVATHHPIVLPNIHCGRERWAVKTLTDPSASSVDLTPAQSTISQLRQTPPSPRPYSFDMPRQPAEQHAYTVDATLREARLEADSDYHLVLADADGNTIVAEIPDPACASGSAAAAQIARARQDFNRLFGAPAAYPASPERPNRAVAVTGVAFYDAEHGQTGSAKIGQGEDIELHPVIAIQPQ